MGEQLRRDAHAASEAKVKAMCKRVENNVLGRGEVASSVGRGVTAIACRRLASIASLMVAGKVTSRTNTSFN